MYLKCIKTVIIKLIEKQIKITFNYSYLILISITFLLVLRD